MATRGTINSNFYQIVDVDANGTPTNIKGEYVANIITEPAGSNTQVQYNNNGNMGANSNFTFNQATNTLTVTNINANGAQLTNITGANVTGTVANATFATNAGSANTANTATVANSANSVAGANVTGTVGNATVAVRAGTVTTNAQPNITSVGTLNGLTVTGTANLGSVNNVKITGGTANFVLRTDGAGNLSWVAQAANAATPGGSNNSVQIKNGNNFAGSNVNITETLNGSANQLYVNFETDNQGLTPGIPTVLQFNSNGNGNGDAQLLSRYMTFQSANAMYLKSGEGFDIQGTNSLVTPASVLIAGEVKFNEAWWSGYAPANVELGNISKLKIIGGSNNQFLQTDGNGNLSFASVSATPGGNTFEVQFNNSGAFGGKNNFVFDSANNVLYAPAYIGNGAGLDSLTGSNISGDVSGANHANVADVANSVSGSNVSGTVANATHATTSDTANSIAGANVSGQVANALVSGTVYTNAQPNITSVGTLSSLSVTGNITANAFVGNGTGLTNIPGANVTGIVPTSANTTNVNIQYQNTLSSNYYVTFSDGAGNQRLNIDDGAASPLIYNPGQGNLFAARFVSLVTTSNGAPFTVTSTQRVANLNVARAGNADVANSVAGANVSGQVGNALIAGTVYTNAQPNITSVGTLSNLNVNGDAVITGNLTVTGNTNFVNVNTLVVQDPIIEQGGGANGAPLTTNDGKDRGSLLHYYTTQPVDAFMGWDNSNGEFAFGSNVTLTNEVATFNSYGNIRASTIIANISGSNVTSDVSGANHANIADVANSVSGSNVVGDVSGANHANIADVANSVSGANVVGDVSGANHANIADVANSVSGSNVSGQVSNALVAGTVYTNAQPNITSLGNLTSLVVTGNTTANYFIGNGASLTNITGANVVGDVSGANHANVADIANSVSGSNVVGAVANATHATTSDTANSVAGANVSGQVANALVAGTVYTNAQPNITSLGTLSTLNVTGNVTANYFVGNGATLTSITGANVTGFVPNANIANTAYSVSVGNVSGIGNIATVNLNGNSSTYLAGDGSWATITGGNATPAGTNTQVQFNDNGAFAGSANLTFDKTTNTLSATNITGTLTTAAQPNITSLGTLASLTVTSTILGNISGSAASAGNATFAISAANANAAINVTGNAQPNITSVGTLSSLSVTGTITGNISGSAATATSATTAGTVTTNAQPNITSVGTLSSLSVTGNITANAFVGNGTGLTNIPGANVTGTVSNTNTAQRANIINTTTNDDFFVTFSADAGIEPIRINDDINNQLIYNPSNGALRSKVFRSDVATGTAPLQITSTTRVANLNVARAGNADVANSVAVANVVGIGNIATINLNGNGTTYLAGNGTWATVSGGNATPGGSNTQVQFNDNGVFGGSANLTFDNTTNTLSVTNITGTLTTGSQPNITSVGTLSSLSVTGTITGNISGSAATATSATTAGTVTTNAQPNITSVGTLIDLTVANTIVGNISGSAATATSATTAGTVTTNAQPNITSVGTLSSLSVTGTITGNISGSAATATSATTAATVTTNAQPNITSVGTLVSLSVSGNANITNTNLVKFGETVVNGGNTGAATLTPDAAAGTIYQYNLTGNITLNTLSNAVAGTSMTIILTQDANGSRLLTSTMKFAGGSKTLSTAANTTDIVSVFYDGTTYYASLVKGFV